MNICILCLYSVWGVCNRFLCKWLDACVVHAWSCITHTTIYTVQCFASYNACIVLRWKVIFSQTHWSGEFSQGGHLPGSAMTSYQPHTHTLKTSMHELYGKHIVGGHPNRRNHPIFGQIFEFEIFNHFDSGHSVQHIVKFSVSNLV